ncbi:YidB family protein [Streptomyces sp. NPDC052811]|uniref:YidB family protein n=1 Tax=Streptomyces sp. NPDC052811 TaxID=3155731 RepID=UPI003437C4ED
MALTVNTNVTSLNVQKNLDNAADELSTSMTRMTPQKLTVAVETLAENPPQTVSWPAEGPNEPVIPEELVQAMGEAELAGLADSLGQDQATFVAELSQTLPGFIDSISTDSRVDENLAAALAEES